MSRRLTIMMGTDDERIHMRLIGGIIRWRFSAPGNAVVDPDGDIEIHTSAPYRCAPQPGRNEVSTKSQCDQIARALRSMADDIEMQGAGIGWVRRDARDEPGLFREIMRTIQEMKHKCGEDGSNREHCCRCELGRMMAALAAMRIEQKSDQSRG